MKTAYIAHRWVRLTACAGLLIASVLLFWLSGGFPPWAWRFLVQVIPQVPHLWATRGIGMVLPFVSLLLLSVTLLIIWAIVGGTGIAMAHHWWRERREWNNFQLDIEEAQDSVSSDTEPMPGRLLFQQDMLEARPLPRPIEPTLPAAATVPRSSVTSRSSGPAAFLPTIYPNQSAPHQPNALSELPDRVTPVTRPTEPMLQAAATAPRIIVPQRPLRSAALLPAAPPGQFMPHQPDSFREFSGDASQSVHGLNGHRTSGAVPPSAGQTLQADAVRLTVGVGSNRGIKRKDDPNEDSVFATQGTCTRDEGSVPFGLFVVADGMGGHANGQVASQLAIKVIGDVVLPALLQNAADNQAFAELLSEGVHHANLAVFQRNRGRSEKEFMGTTLTAALVVGNIAYVANVGDSRTYLYRKGQGLRKITRDHSKVARLVEEQKIKPDDIYTHEERNVIERCLGEKPSVLTDSFNVPLSAGDILFLCSDGLWEMVRDPDIEQILQTCHAYPSQAKDFLIQAALNRGGKDNVSVIVVYVM